MQTRFPRGLSGRIEQDDLPIQGLEAIRQLRSYLDDRELCMVLRARELGATTTQIADALGLTRQAMHNRLRAINEGRRGRPIPSVDG